jgi:hypothetical protein
MLLHLQGISWYLTWLILSCAPVLKRTISVHWPIGPLAHTHTHTHTHCSYLSLKLSLAKLFRFVRYSYPAVPTLQFDSRLNWRKRQYVRLQHWYPLTRLQRVTTQKASINIITTVKRSKPILFIQPESFGEWDGFDTVNSLFNMPLQ